MVQAPYGFRILGSLWETRRLVDAAAAFSAYAACDPRAECHREAYLSAFQYGEDFRQLLTETGSTAGFSGPCWAPWLWFDIDAEGDLDRARAEAEALVEVLMQRYSVAAGDLLIFFSGSKGFHLGLPTSLWAPAPSADFYRVCRRFAEHVADLAAVTIDSGVYDRVRAFRAPNSRHPKTGLHKRRLSLDELTGLALDAILSMAKTPQPFDVPTPRGTSDQAAADWQAAAAAVQAESEAKAERRAAGNGAPQLNRATLDFIRHGAAVGDRHRLLFSAAANLAEFGCPPRLAEALLEESALDSGLPPKEVRRQIACGWRAGWTGRPNEPTPQDAPESPQEAPEGSPVEEPSERDPGDPRGLSGPQCQEGTGVPPADLRAALARLWNSTPASKDARADAVRDPATEGSDSQPTQADSLPTPLPPLPPPLRCHGDRTDWMDERASDGRIRTTCRRCGRFLGYRTGGPTA